MRAMVPITAVVLIACGVETPRARLEQPIFGGVPAPEDRSVFHLQIDGDNDAGTTCSAALIAPRTLMTAAHCVDPVMFGAQTVRITANESLNVDVTRLHPRWNPATLANDLALLQLPSPSAERVLPWSSKPIASADFDVRAIGFGRTEDGSMGERRSAKMPVQEVLATTLRIGDLAEVGICFGDSGGPSLRNENGVERIVGIHSTSRSAACNDGFDSRVDVAAPFIRDWLAEYEDACVFNNLCADHPCTTPDPDCVEIGVRCDSDVECASRECITDLQHANSYCSAPCTTDCSGGLHCNVTRGLCEVPQRPTVQPFGECTPGIDFCAQGTTCVNGRCCDGTTCVAPVKTLPYAGVVTAPNQGCSTGSGLLTLAALLLFQRRIHRSSGEVRSSLCRADSNRRGAT